MTCHLNPKEHPLRAWLNNAPNDVLNMFLARAHASYNPTRRAKQRKHEAWASAGASSLLFSPTELANLWSSSRKTCVLNDRLARFQLYANMLKDLATALMA